MQLVSKLALNLLWIGAVAFILAASAASAETYPPDGGAIDVGTDNDTPGTGEDVTVTATVVDADGNPVEGAVVTFTISENPGDATFSNGEQEITAITDENGVAIVTLNTGGTAGSIVVVSESDGMVAQVTLNSGGPQALPLTGGPISASDSTPLSTVLLAIGGGLVLLAGGGIAMRRSRILSR